MKALILSLTLILTFSGITVFAQQMGGQPDMTIDPATRAQTIDAILTQLNDRYIFPDVAKKMENDVRMRLQNKEYDQITSAKEFSQKLTADLQSISHDKHLRVLYSAMPLPLHGERNEPTAAEIAADALRFKSINYGFERVERLQGNIGYIDLRGFADPKAGAETVAASMNFVTNTNALIFDLRQNGGGDSEMVALICSYLFGDQPVHLNDLYWREGSRTEESWTKPTVIGKKYDAKDIYLLTSNRSFSGAEEFANDLKILKRATIVGETTGGGANPGDIFRLTEHFRAFVPTGRAINPITKTNWEGTGVEPDIKVPKELALKTAYLLALNKSLDTATDENLKGALKNLIAQTQKELDELKNNSK